MQAQLCSEHCKPSPLVERPADFVLNHPNPYVDVHERIVRSPAAAVLPLHRAWKSYSDLLVPAFERIWTGADPRTELAGVAARAQGLVDRSDAAHRAREARG